MFRHPFRLVAAAAAVAATTGGVGAAAATSPAPSARAALTVNCPSFQVVRGGPMFSAGTYRRQAFGPAGSRVPSCDETLRVFRSWLANPRAPVRGWVVGPLTGPHATAIGRRFTRAGSGGRVGFEVWRDAPRPVAERTLSETIALPAGVSTHRVYFPTSSTLLRADVRLVDPSPGAHLMASGFARGANRSWMWADVEVDEGATASLRVVLRLRS